MRDMHGQIMNAMLPTYHRREYPISIETGMHLPVMRYRRVTARDETLEDGEH